KRAHAAALLERESAKARARLMRGKVAVSANLLAPTNSYDTPDFLRRGYYVDRPFKCKDCGVDQVWTDTQQRWWYEVAHGDVWTVAVRCRACRLKERTRKAHARRVQQEGFARKNRNKA